MRQFVRWVSKDFNNNFPVELVTHIDSNWAEKNVKDGEVVKVCLTFSIDGVDSVTWCSLQMWSFEERRMFINGTCVSDLIGMGVFCGKDFAAARSGFVRHAVQCMASALSKTLYKFCFSLGRHAKTPLEYI